MTWFDIAILVVTILSAVMSMGRGLVREAFSLIAFIIGIGVGLALWVFAGPPLKQLVSPNDDALWPFFVLALVGFLASYAVAAFIGQRLSKLIHSSPEIGVLDRIVGAVFGVVRGLVAGLLLLLLIEQILPESAMPQDIVKARTYPYFHAATSWVRSVVPGFLQGVTDAISQEGAKDRASP